MKTNSPKKSASKTVANEIEQKLNEISEKNQKQLQNIFQHLPAATAVLEGPEHKFILANKAYEKLFNRKEKDILGKCISEVFPELKGTSSFELLDRVFENGESFSAPEYASSVNLNNGNDQQGYFNFSMEPLRNDSGEIYAVIVMMYPITDQVHGRKKLEERKMPKAFLLKLSDALRPLSDPLEIEGTATKIALDFMDADRCYYNTLEKGNAIVMRDSFRVGLTSLAGVYPISNFPLFKAVVDAGRPFIVDDVYTSEIIEEGLRQICVQVQVISMINIPVIKSGKTVGVLSLVQSKPRKWTETEVQLTIETAERIWAAVEKAKAEEALRQSEEKYRTLFTSMDQGFTLCELIRNKEGKGIDFYILEVNSTYEQQTGVNKAMVVGKPLLQVFPSLDKLLETYAAVVDNQCPIVFENYFEDTDRWFAIKAYPVEKERFAVLFSDITERKKAEEKIIESERQIREIKEHLELSIGASKIGVWFWDVKEDILTWSNEQKEIYGFSASDIITSSAQFNALIVPEDLKRIQDDQGAANKSDHEYDFRIIRKNDGELRWVKSRARNTFDSQGALQSISGVNIDVTEQVLALNKIQESESRFRSMADASPVLIWTLDANGWSSYYNQTFLDFIGSKDDDISDWKKIVHPDDIQSTFDTINTAIAKNSSYTLECRLLRADGQWRWVLCQGNPRMGANNEFLGFVGSGADLTERKKYEYELMEAKAFAENAAKSRQQFLSIMSHEIRTPLNSIIGFTNVLFKTKLGTEQKEFVQAIQTSGKSLNLLINDILDLAKVDAGKMTFETQPFEIRKSITSLIHSFDIKIREKNLALDEEYDHKIPSILLGDSLRLNQIFLNLISNAVKFTHKGKIKLSVELLSETSENVTLKFVVADSGIGIADNKLDSIFNLFEQAEHSTSTSYGGTGLGLAIVKQLVEVQGGRIGVKSKLGEGSAFSFVLPFGKTNIKLKAEIEILKPDSEIKNLRVLVAEDIALNQLLIKIILNDFGFEYEIVGNGKLAIEKMQTNTYDIILMDLQMPEMNGFEATEYIRKTLKSHIPIIALTADVTTMDVSKCKELGMDGYISKPIEEKLLYNKIVELVKKNK